MSQNSPLVHSCHLRRVRRSLRLAADPAGAMPRRRRSAGTTANEIDRAGCVDKSDAPPGRQRPTFPPVAAARPDAGEPRTLA